MTCKSYEARATHRSNSLPTPDLKDLV